MITWLDNMDEDVWYYADVQEATNSHDFIYEPEDCEYETWTELLEIRDWAALEEEWRMHILQKTRAILFHKVRL